MVFSQCRKKTILSGSGVTLSFSVDTVLFDTVFTSVGSTTYALKVYNTFQDPIVVSNIVMANGSNSQYRMNVDGINGYAHSDIEIAGEDSIYIFVEVTVDPNSFDLPFILEDSIMFTTNGNHQAVKLHAWGQNAIFHGSLDAISVLPPDQLLWNSNLPHVLYGVVAVDSAQTLTILAGTQVFCHARSGLWMYKSNIDIQGEYGNEVVFQGDRLEPVYFDEPGQWGIAVDVEYQTNFGLEEFTVTRGGIWIQQSEGSSIDWAIIKNGVIGIQVDTMGSMTTPALRITNTKVFNHSAIGILGQGASITGSGNLFANCGQVCGQFSIGGEYNFDYTTFANYWSFGTRQSPTFVLNNYYEDINQNLQIRPIYNTSFHNCIMYGSNADQEDYNEFIIDLEDEENQEYLFSNCWVDTDESISNEHYQSMHNNQSVNFVGPTMDDFHLSSGIYTNVFEGLINSDLDNKNRQEYWLGCYDSESP